MAQTTHLEYVCVHVCLFIYFMSREEIEKGIKLWGITLR